MSPYSVMALSWDNIIRSCIHTLCNAKDYAISSWLYVCTVCAKNMEVPVHVM